jgi:hypothetical protein
VTKIEPWRAGDNDRIDGTRGWQLGTVASPPGTAQRLGKVAPKGLILTAEGAAEATRFDVTTLNVGAARRNTFQWTCS